MKRRGFTLIELLVVISIIALLIAILLPSLSRARGLAKRAVCSSNMHSLAQAVYLYANDHKDRLVTVGLSHGGQARSEQASWIETLKEDYGRNEKIARCPSDESDAWTVPIAPPDAPGDAAQNDEASDPEQDETKPILRRTSYATTYYTAARIGNRGPYDVLGLIRKPGSTVLFAELVEVGPFAVSDHVHPETWWSNPRLLASREMAIGRHLGQANYAFFDGHVASHMFEDTYSIDNKRSSLRNIVWQHNFYDPNVGR